MRFMYTVLLLMLLQPLAQSISIGSGPNRSMSPIRIDSDENLISIASEQGWEGEGSIQDPFIIDGQTIPAYGSANCIYVGNTSLSLMIRDCQLTDALSKNTIMAQGAGIAIFRSSNITIVNCTSMENQGMGISIFESKNILVHKVSTKENGRFGISVHSSKNIHISQNDIQEEREIGLDIMDTTNLTLNGTKIVGSFTQNIQFRGRNEHISIFGSTSSNSRLGIGSALPLNDLTVRDCEIVKNGFGISLTGGSRITLDSLTVADSPDIGIMVRDIDHLSLRGTHIQNCTVGLRMSNVSSGLVEGNDLTENFLGIFVEQGSTWTNITGNLISFSRTYGMRLSGAELVKVMDNSFIYNYRSSDHFVNYLFQVDDNSDSNTWSGNHFRDHRWPDYNMDGLVDDPYNDASGPLDHRPRRYQISPLISPPNWVRTFSVRNGISLVWEPVVMAEGYRLFRSDGESVEPMAMKLVNISEVVDEPIENEETMYYQVCSIRSDGIPSDPSPIVTGRSDVFGPLVEIVSPLDGAYVMDDSISVHWQSIDTVSSVIVSRVYLDGILEKEIYNSTGPYIISRVKEGPHTLIVECEDRNGNFGNHTIMFTTDISKPRIKFLSPTNSTIWRYRDLAIQWSVEDDLSPIITVEYNLDTGPWIVTEGGKIDLLSLRNGPHILKLRTKDASGNQNESSFFFRIDTIAPQVLSFGPTDIVHHLDEEVYIEFDESIDLDSFTMNISNTTGYLSSKYNSFKYLASGGLKYGMEYIVSVLGEDLAGNRIEFEWSFLTVDDTGSLTMKVVDERGFPLYGVIAMEEADELGQTNRDGLFYLVLTTGIHYIEIASSDYHHIAIQVIINREAVTDLGTIVLERKDVPLFGSVYIRVIDGKGYPKEGAVVFLDGLPTNLTNDEGWVHLFVLVGVHTFMAEYNRLSTEEITLTVPNENYNGTLTLILVDPNQSKPINNKYLPILFMLPVLVITLIVLLYLHLRNRSYGRSIGRFSDDSRNHLKNNGEVLSEFPEYKD